MLRHRRSRCVADGVKRLTAVEEVGSFAAITMTDSSSAIAAGWLPDPPMAGVGLLPANRHGIALNGSFDLLATAGPCPKGTFALGVPITDIIGARHHSIQPGKPSASGLGCNVGQGLPDARSGWRGSASGIPCSYLYWSIRRRQRAAASARPPSVISANSF